MASPRAEANDAASAETAALALLLEQQESALHRREVRASAERLCELLDEDFEELGVSGLHWTRATVIEALRNESFSERRIADFRLRSLSDGLALVTYRVQRMATPVRPGAESLRSSLWRGKDGRWRMLFHQGTPL
jgi:glyoxylase I family protein